MLYFRMGDQVFHGSEDLCNARLVVCSEKRGAVGDDQVLTHIVLKEAEGLFVDGDLVVQDDVAAFVVDSPGLNVSTGCTVRGVHVSDEADGGFTLAAGGGRQPTVDVAILVYPCIFKAYRLHLLRQIPAQLQFFRRRRAGLAGLVGRGLEGYIF